MQLRIFGAVIVILAILLALIPAFNNCYQDGKVLTLENGKTAPMKCLWTARAAIAVAIPLALVGVLLALSRSKETRRGLHVMGIALGGIVMLLPTTLIGVCTTMTASCNQVTRPSLLAIGATVIGLNLVALVVSERRNLMPA